MSTHLRRFMEDLVWAGDLSYRDTPIELNGFQGISATD